MNANPIGLIEVLVLLIGFALVALTSAWAINMAAIPDNLLESELFGYEKGAFTDATEAKAGYFENANGGTLFLDEIAEMPYGVQAKLLRALRQMQILETR